MVQLFLSDDPSVRHAAAVHLQLEEKRKILKFRLAVLVSEVKSQDPHKSRRQLSVMVKSMVAMEEADERQEQLHSLPLQGKMARCLEDHAAEL